jgi:ribosomal protein S18 acetylase RimI-like enzyme
VRVKSHVLIREAAAADTDGILECLRGAFEPFRASYTGKAFSDTVPTRAAIKRRLSSMQVYVAVTETNQVVGTIGCSVTNRDEGHIRGMAVDRTWQGSGVARELLETAEVALLARGCSRVTLDTTAPLERAIRFYEKNGFQATGRVMDFFGMPLYEYAKPLNRPPR